MADIDRRVFNKLLGTAATAGLVAGVTGVSAALADDKPVPQNEKLAPKQGGAVLKRGKARVVIIGGGVGGASVAHHLRTSAPELEVTLVEPRKIYTTCFFSNHYIGGFRSIRSLQHNYDALKKNGVTVIHDYASGVDPVKKLVFLKGERVLPYDKLVLSPGVEMKYEAIEGYSKDAAKIMPHAWLAGEQTQILRRRLVDMKDGGTVIITVPANPYRCPPAPYERATLIAHYLKYHKPASKLIILDAKSVFPKMELFEEVWTSEYKGLVEWIPGDKHGGVIKALANEMSVVTRNGDVVKGEVVNIIPPQKAGIIAARAGCTSGDWCPIIPDSFASRLVEDVFVLGDAANGRSMPKSASAANSQAHVVANAIAAQLLGKKMFPPRYRNACWSLLSANNAIKAGGSYTAGKEFVEERTSFISEVKEDAGMRAANFKESLDWYFDITSDMFAKG